MTRRLGRPKWSRARLMERKNTIFKSFQNRRLSLRLLCYVVLASVIFGLLTSSIRLYSEYRKEISTLTSNLESLETSYVPAITEAAYRYDDEQLKILIDGAIQLSDISYLVIEQERVGQPYLISRGEVQRENLVAKEYPLIVSLPNGETSNFGSLKVESSLSGIQNRTWDRLGTVLVTNLASVLLMGLVVFITFQFVLTRHLTAIARFTQGISLDDLDQELSLNRKSGNTSKPDELEQLVLTLNEMRLRLGQGILERRRTEELLRKSEVMYRTLVESSPYCIHQIDNDGKIMSMNRAGLEMIGLTDANEIVGVPYISAVCVQDQGRISKLLDEAFAGKFSEFEFRGTERIEFSSNFVPIFNEQGRVDRLLGITQDITERKRIEGELVEAIQRFSRISDNIEDIFWLGIAEAPSDFRMIYVNKAFEKIWQRTADEVYRDNSVWHDCIHPEDIDGVATAFARFLEGQDGFEQEFRIVRPDGTTRILTSKGELVIDSEEGSVRAVGITRDVTARKQAEQESREAQKQLLDRQRQETELAQQQLDLLRNQLVRQTRLATIGKTTACIAHEIRNPLGAMRNAAYILKRHSLSVDPDFKKYLGIIDQEITTADRVIRNMLEQARSKEPEKSEIDLEVLIRDSFDRFRFNRNVQFHLTCQPSPHFVNADRDQMNQVLGNLITNSVQAMADKGDLHIDLQMQDDHHVIKISDTGTGVSNDARDQLFDPLFSTKAKGTGLGLTVCQQIVERHGGTIELANSDQNGASFLIRLPAGKKRPSSQ